MGEQRRLFSVTICAKRKPGMDEDAYHKHISQTHAEYLKGLLVKNRIVEYTMQYNTSALMKDISDLFPGVAATNQSSDDAYITIVFQDPQDYINVKKDPYYAQVIGPGKKFRVLPPRNGKRITGVKNLVQNIPEMFSPKEYLKVQTNFLSRITSTLLMVRVQWCRMDGLRSMWKMVDLRIDD